MTKAASIPKDQYGGYASTWGEFDFGSTENDGWSGFDVSAIQAQYAQLEVQGMQICSALNKGLCSYITKGAKVVHNAYTTSTAELGGIGGNLLPGPVRLAVEIGFEE
ncbi:Allergen Asp f 4 [Penicillium subrubescens]|uniref:Allergen Asp f 4 n=2 Tax=Penicillium subrubescens TaxID=1316194 RepID=A0A1Q5UC11_9EURO|nr:Allergen Asp f 4 [Penicillium subrubescens]OKP10014.1 Allergen Asp f 4 [Penicillium subrubescens]